MSLTRVDLPEPETPVTTVSRPRGRVTSTSFRLFARAPRIWMALPLGLRRFSGTEMWAAPGGGRGGWGLWPWRRGRWRGRGTRRRAGRAPSDTTGEASWGEAGTDS